MKTLSFLIIFTLIGCTSSPVVPYTDSLPNFKETAVPKVQKEIERYRIKYNDQNIFKDSFTADVNNKSYEIKKLKRLILHVDRDYKMQIDKVYNLKKYRDWSLFLTAVPFLLFLNNSRTYNLLAMGLGVGGYVYFDSQIKEQNSLLFEDYNRKLEKNFFYYKVNF